MTDSEFASLPDDPMQLKELVRELSDALDEKQLRYEHLEHRLGLLLKSKFGPRRERFAPGQQELFDIGEEETKAEGDATSDEDESSATAKPKRRGHGRRRLPHNLLRERREHDLSDEEKLCPCCGKPRKRIGWETSEQLDYEPARLFAIEHARAKYACEACEENVAVAPKPPQPIEKGLAAPGLLAAVAVGKYGDHLPLYRMEEILSRSGVAIGRSTQAGWMRRCGELARPLVERMTELVLAGACIWTDDTTVPVLDPERDKTKTGRLWVYIGDLKHRYAVFDYSPDRQGRWPRDFLRGYGGYLQADAYSGYDELCDRGPVSEVACWAHARRKFYDARETARVVAHDALSRIGQLYRIEKKLDEAEPEKRLAMRQKHAVLQLEKFKTWLDEQSERQLPKSPIGGAIRYARTHWDALYRYTEDGRLSIDNNLSERTLRCVAVGRKNWLFAGNDDGGRTAATMYSLIASCKLLGVDPYRYLRALFTELPSTAAAELDSLLPDRWLAANPHAKLVEHEAGR